MPHEFRKRLPLVKVDPAQRIVYGQVTAEVVDRDNEICHYESTVPYYKELNEEFAKATDGKSIAPLREMHQLSAVGVGKEIHFDDQGKQILMGFKVVDDAAWKKVEEGVYTGFSQGGKYIKRWKQDGKDYYTAQPGEISLVDNPCLASAHFEYVKADGTVELRKFSNTLPPGVTEENFAKLADAVRAELLKDTKTKRKGGKDLPASAFAYVGDPDDTSTWKLPIHDAAHVRNALARFNQTQGIPAGEKARVKAKIRAAAKKFGIEVSDESKKAAQALEFISKPISKGMYEVGTVAECIATLQWVQQCLTYERDAEGDSSTAPDDLRTALEDLCAFLNELVAEETGELLEGVTAKGINTMNPEQIKKAAAALGMTEDEFSKQFLQKAKGIAALKGHIQKAIDHHESMHKAHKALGELHAEHAGHLGKCMKACDGVMGDDDGKKALEAEELRKSEEARIAAEAAKNGGVVKLADVEALIKKATEASDAKIAELQKKLDEVPAAAGNIRVFPRTAGGGEPISKSSGAVDPMAVEA